jgi:AcrR family transcriptional regulator
VYRFFGSKDELLASIMRSYWAKFTTAWEGVLKSSSTPIEKLDALMWVNINVMDRFSDEFKIQLAWLRQSPPATPSVWFSPLAQLRQVRELLAAGSRLGEIAFDGASADVRAQCVFETILMPEDIVRQAGTLAAFALARNTVLSGAVAR